MHVASVATIRILFFIFDEGVMALLHSTQEIHKSMPFRSARSNFRVGVQLAENKKYKLFPAVLILDFFVNFYISKTVYNLTMI